MSLQDYKIWTDDGLIEKENAQVVRHENPQAAIEEFVEKFDQRSGDYYFANDFAWILFAEDESGDITKWNLTVESKRQYYVTQIKEGEKPK